MIGGREITRRRSLLTAPPQVRYLAIEQDARELHVQHLLGHSSTDMVRRYASTFNSEQAARRHIAFSPAERLGNGL